MDNPRITRFDARKNSCCDRVDNNRRNTARRNTVNARPINLLRLLIFVSVLASTMLLPRPAMAEDEPPITAAAAAVSDHLAQELASAQEPVSFLIILRDQVDAARFVSEATIQAASRESRATALYQELTARARANQAPLRAWLTSQGIAYRAFYLVNMIEVQGDAALAAALTERPEVARLVSNPQVANALTIPLEPSIVWAQQLAAVAATEAKASVALPYGLEYTHATDVWAKGYTGQGIVVASQDTGVEWDHPALQPAYRGMISTTVTTTLTAALNATGGVTTTVDHVYNWFDAWDTQGRPSRCVQDAQIPCDDHGHGTHTVGTMLGDATGQGDSILGMAPDAEWIGCRNMLNGFGTPASYTACFEFFLAPYPQGGDPFADGRPELAPHIINNSWGCPPVEGCDATSLRQVVETMRAAGQMVVASAGNDGAGCSSVRNPISMHDAVFSVGAHSSTGTIAGFSSRGPVTADSSGRLKPEISAPGVAVRSTWVNNGYNTIQGTSMASPHVAGAVALLWSAVPSLVGDIDKTEQILIKSATPVPANACGEGDDPVVPNNTYGYGRLDILAAVEMAQAPMGLTIAVTDEDAEPIAEKMVTVIDNLTGYRYIASTYFNGTVHFPDLFTGDYDVEVAGATTQSITLENNQPGRLTMEVTTATPTIYLPQVMK